MRRKRQNHNALPTQVILVNRIVEEANLPSFYEGIFSEERIYRIDVLNALFGYIRKMNTE